MRIIVEFPSHASAFSAYLQLKDGYWRRVRSYRRALERGDDREIRLLASWVQNGADAINAFRQAFAS